MLRGILSSSGNEPRDGLSPFRYELFRLELSQDGRLNAHPDRIFRVVEKYLNHHIILRRTDQQCPSLPKSRVKYLDLGDAKSSLPLVAVLVDGLQDVIWELIPRVSPRSSLNSFPSSP